MKIINTLLSDILILEPEFQNENSKDLIVYSSKEFENIGIKENFVQQNFSHSKYNVLRGLHYQIHKPQGKLIRVISGSVFDVVVDIRKSSANYGKYSSFELSDKNNHMVWIPPGYAHGFYVLSDSVDFIYSVTNYRSLEFERILLWNDPELNIKWPFNESTIPFLSEKDKNGICLKNIESF
jgi:dTDP-4-dehydrorhamnose 3,5-epimerase